MASKAIQIVPSQTAAFISAGRRLFQRELPATLIKKGLATTETIKVQLSADNGGSWFDAVDENGAVQFAATGKNVMTIDSPMLFRLNKSTTVAVAEATLSLGDGNV